MSQQSEVIQHGQTRNRDNYYQNYHIKKMLGVLKKYYFRNFMSNFKSCVFQSLLKNTNKPPQIVYVEKIVNDWPYRSLLMKKNKTEHEILELQFVSMCAEKIQSVFRGYITRKRHKIALNRLRRFTSKALACIRGWKVRQVMRCLKIKQQMKTIKIKRAEVIREQENLAQTQNKYSIRKLQYLQKSLHDQVNHFLRKFDHLYETGGWVFEPKIQKHIMKKPQINKFHRKAVEPVIQANFNQTQTNDFLPSETVKKQVPKPKRVRQMRNNARQAKNKVQAPKIEDNNFAQTKSESYQSESTNFASEDRPIKAKGAYKYDQQIQKQEILNQKPISSNNAAELGPQGDNQKAQIKKIDKKKYEKRQKYDPRKAIQQEKQRKKEQQELQSKMVVQKVESTTNIEIPSHNESKQKTIKQTKSQKVIKMPEKEEISNRSTVNIPKAKTKVQARIDCWGNRKTKKVTTLQNDRSTNKIVAIVEQLEPEPPKNRTNELITLEKLTNKIQQRKVLNRERQKQREREEFEEERANALREMERHKEQSERARLQSKKQSYEIHKKMSIEENRHIKAQNILNMRQKPKNVEEPPRRKEMVYRPVEQLEQAYQNQYINRFQNLMPKLRLLSAARLAQQRSNIPVLSSDSFYVERMLQQNPAPQKFWQTVSRMEKTIKDFINS